MADETGVKIRFYVSRQGKEFVARAADLPLTVSAPSFKTLRALLDEEVERRVGPRRAISLLLGAPRLPPRSAAPPHSSTRDLKLAPP